MLYLDSPREEVWTKFLSGDRIEASESLIRTWSRSLTAGVDWQSPKNSRTAPVLDRGEARIRKEAGEPGWRFVKPMLEKLSSQLENNGFLGVWADAGGVILHQRGGGKFLTTAQRLELYEGANWSESARGTNAIGTALSEGCEVAVLGRAHLQKVNHDLVCYAAPVFSPFGELMGALDVTSHVDLAQNLAWAAVLTARFTIEQAMKHAAYKQTIYGGLDSIYQLMESCGSPTFLIERDGTIRNANTRAKARFGKQTPAIPLAANWAELVGGNAQDQIVECKNQQGKFETLNLIVEPVGCKERPFAALIRLERIETKRSSTVGLPVSSGLRESKALQKLHGDDPVVQDTLNRLAKLAPTNLPILLLAETGTGKEALARGLHQLSKRATGPFVAINCGALSESLLESELFGYGGGAFTGANPRGARGKIDMAHGGTLFLDEIADMPLCAQTRLLRVLEDGSYFRVGESQERFAKVRIVAATCRPIETMVKENRMRPDLYYRLKGAVLKLPPVRFRTDLRVLAEGLLGDLALKNQCPVPVMTRAFIQALAAYDWPGNIRELKNTLHVALVFSDGASLLQPEHLPEDIREHSGGAYGPNPSRLMEQAEFNALDAALRQTRNLSEAARKLGIARSTLYRMLRRHGLRD